MKLKLTTNRFTFTKLIAITTVFAATIITGCKTGTRYLFPSPVFHAQALRTMGHSIYSGATPAEVLSVIGNIKDGDEEGWYSSWYQMASKCEKQADEAADNLTKGNLLLRASNYYRASEIMLNPEKLKRKQATYEKSSLLFTHALQLLKIKHIEYTIPYNNAMMRIHYYPGEKNKPLIISSGGGDSTIEEVFFYIASPMISRGYPVVIFEGPGQSNMIRKYSLHFTPDWNIPVTKVIDYITLKNPELKVRKKIFYGPSLGGLLAARAVAFEKRIDGVVLFGAPVDLVDATFSMVPSFARYTYNMKFKNLFNLMAYTKCYFDTSIRWSLNLNMWTFGADTPYDLIIKSEPFTLKDVYEKITCDVLIINGEHDRFFNDMANRAKEEPKKFTHAKSVSSYLFTETDGASEHCQIGSLEQDIWILTKWMKEKGY